MCVGLRPPIIVVNSGAVELLDDDELRCLLGHELGHALSGHAVYRTMIVVLTNLAVELRLVSGRGPGAAGDRRRVVGVVAQGGAVRRPGRPARLPGPGRLTEVVDEAGRRRRSVRGGHRRVPRAGGRVRAQWRSARQPAQAHARVAAHPSAAGGPGRRDPSLDRVRRLPAHPRRHYPRRDDDATASVPEDVKEAAESYRESFARSEDPLAKLLRRLGDGADEVGEWVGAGAGKLRDWVAAAGRSARGAAFGGDERAAAGGDGVGRPPATGRGGGEPGRGLRSPHDTPDRG